LNERVAFDIRIKSMRGANAKSEFSPHANRINGDDCGCPGDPRALNGAESQRTAAHNRHARCGLNRRKIGRCRSRETGHAYTTAHHAKFYCVGAGEQRDDPLFRRDHQLG